MTCMSDDAIDNAIASVLRVSPDWSADPVWDPTGMVDLDGLPITEALRSDWGVTLLVDSRYQEGTTRRDVIETQEVHPGVQG